MKHAKIHKEGNIGNDASDDDEEELSSEYDSNEDDIMNENKENDTKYYFCNECDYKCSRSVLYLDKHMKTVNNNHQEPTVEDSSISKSGNKKKSCPYCDYHTFIKINLERHIKSVHSQKEFAAKRFVWIDI